MDTGNSIRGIERGSSLSNTVNNCPHKEKTKQMVRIKNTHFAMDCHLCAGLSEALKAVSKSLFITLQARGSNEGEIYSVKNNSVVGRG